MLPAHAIVGAAIPADTPHAVSVSLPTWRANVGYEEGQEWVMSKMKTGYPRFYIHKSIQKLVQSILQKFGQPDEDAMLFPSPGVAKQCKQFIKQRSKTIPAPNVRVIELVYNKSKNPKTPKDSETPIWSDLCTVLFPTEEFKCAKEFWQHSGDGVSSRRAEFCQREFEEGSLVEKSLAAELEDNHPTPPLAPKGPKRYSRLPRVDAKVHSQSDLNGEIGEDSSTYVEERFGRNLDVAFIENAKLAIRRRIAGTLKSNLALKDALEQSDEGGRLEGGFSENDVYLHPTGMSAIFNTHRFLMSALGHKKSVSYGFPYIDTLKILQKFGPGCYFYGNGSQEDLDDLQAKCESGEEILALFCEFPSNPLLKAPNLVRIRELADKYNFAVVIDETVGNFLNVNVLPYADVVVSSLTKVFSGDSNVMGGSSVLNPKGRYYQQLKQTLNTEFEDNYWGEDALFLERNSRDFVSRIARINKNAETIMKEVYYPKYSPTKPYYDNCRCENGGYGGLLSVIFYSREDAIAVFDTMEVSKGPSLGTNFTLASPYTLLAHYGELDWAAQFGVASDLIRISVGLEETEELVDVLNRALAVL
ncbi:uncharacterized protein H6S33_005665 [Morchella sextelata]|uniref:uncharacterized protein n=1 Tax=Morchella sextelata TaxID=1174677 RepID=UPI001D049DD0|nr:uncharacterized protein H6S33_005665 [Morchella sextelata]KAH0613779.1 hypothetical protein H6S33_005665 [Morchella sextelata]